MAKNEESDYRSRARTHEAVDRVIKRGGRAVAYARNTTDLHKLELLLGEGPEYFTGDHLFEEAVASVLEVEGSALFVVSLGAIETEGSSHDLYGFIERLVMADRGLWLKHLSYDTVPLHETNCNLMDGPSLQKLLDQIGVAAGVESMLSMGNDARSKIDESDVDAMRKLDASGVTRTEIARRFGVTRMTVFRKLRDAASN